MKSGSIMEVSPLVGRASQLSQEPALHGSLAALLNAHGWARLTGRMQPLPVLLVVS